MKCCECGRVLPNCMFKLKDDNQYICVCCLFDIPSYINDVIKIFYHRIKDWTIYSEASLHPTCYTCKDFIDIVIEKIEKNKIK